MVNSEHPGARSTQTQLESPPCGLVDRATSLARCLVDGCAESSSRPFGLLPLLLFFLCCQAKSDDRSGHDAPGVLFDFAFLFNASLVTLCFCFLSSQSRAASHRCPHRLYKNMCLSGDPEAILITDPSSLAWDLQSNRISDHYCRIGGSVYRADPLTHPQMGVWSKD